MVFTYNWSVIFNLSTSRSIINSTLVILWIEVAASSSIWWVATSCHILIIWVWHHHFVLVNVMGLKPFLTLSMVIGVLIVILRKMVWVDHAEHFWKSLSNSSNSLRWVSEWKLTPWLERNLLAIHINDIFGAGCTWSATKRFLGKHGIIFFGVGTTLAHEQIIHIF